SLLAFPLLFSFSPQAISTIEITDIIKNKYILLIKYTPLIFIFLLLDTLDILDSLYDFYFQKSHFVFLLFDLFDNTYLYLPLLLCSLFSYSLYKSLFKSD